MADSIYLFAGEAYTTNLLELALNTNDLQLLVPGSEMGAPQHENIWHTSPWVSGERLVRHRVKNRTWPVRLLAGDKNSASPADDLADALAALERLVLQARRAQTDEDVEEIGLYIKLDGASRATYYTVLDMECSGMSLLEEISRLRKDAQASFVLVTKPFGYGDQETLENWLLTPHFEEDGNADGLADNWTESGTPTTTLDTDTYLCGSQSQKVVTDTAGTDGIYADTVYCSGNQGDSFVAYAWVYKASGDEVTLDVVGDVSGSLGTATYSAATTTATGEGNNTWYRLEVTGTVGASDTTLTFRVERLSGDAAAATTYYVDKCYLQLDASAVPTAWCSQRTIYQHSDADAGKVCYLDVTDVPGDVEAETEFMLYANSTGIGYVHAGRRSAGRKQAAGGYYQSLPAVGDTAYSADATRINGGTWTTTPTSTWAPVGDTHPVYGLQTNGLSGRFRAFASINDANGSSATEAERADFWLHVYPGNVIDTEAVKTTQMDHNTRWQWVDLGFVDIARPTLRAHFSTDTDDNDMQAFLQLMTKRDTGSYAISCDALLLIPLETDAFLTFEAGVITTTLIWHLTNLGIDEDVALVRDTVGASWWWEQKPELLGHVPRLYPKLFHRFYWLATTTVLSGGTYYKNLSVPSDYVRIRTTYRPRTKFLIGSA